jgi:hypothetical protein
MNFGILEFLGETMGIDVKEEEKCFSHAENHNFSKCPKETIFVTEIKVFPYKDSIILQVECIFLTQIQSGTGK